MWVTQGGIVRLAVAFCGGLLTFVGSLPTTAATKPVSVEAVQTLIDSEKFEQATEALQTLDAQGTVPSHRISLLMGRIYLALGKPSKAVEFFERAAFSPLEAEADARLGLAEAYLALGNLAKARSEAQWALKSDPDIVAPHLVLARIDQRLGRSAEAQERLQTLQSGRPGSEEVAIILARFHAQQDGAGRAASDLRRFLKSHPTSAAAHDALGQFLWADGQEEGAISARKRARELYAKQGQTGRTEAIDDWLQAVALEPEKHTLPPEAPPPPATRPRPPVEASPLPPPQQARVIRAAILAKPEPLPFPPGSPIMTGSGVVLEGGLRIITNRHVVEDMTAIAVRNGIGHVRLARVVQLSSDQDLALLEIDTPFPDGGAMPLSDIVEPHPGRAAIVMGYPLIGILGDEQPALTEGIVAKGAGLANDPNTFQLTAKINKGNSGGPVFDRQGRLLGLAAGKMDTAGMLKENGILPEDMNFGIKGSRILHFLGKPPAQSEPAREELSLEDLYQAMLPRTVLIAAQKGKTE